MAQKIYNITEEQVDSIESEFMTRDALAIIANDIRTNDAPPIHEVAKDLLERCLIILKELDPNGNCRLYEMDSGYCNSKCPFSAKHYGGFCGVRVMKTDLKRALGVD